MEVVSTTRAHDGTQGVYCQASKATGTDMTFSVFLPEHDDGERLPVLWFLSGLACTHANVTDKGEYRRACAERRVVFVAPDTSPRGPGVPDDDGYDIGQGAGFYLDATEPPWSEHFQMERYIMEELPGLIAAEFPVATDAQGITGHSMGGHGALTLALRHPNRFRTVSALAPIVAPARVPWGEKAFAGYLGEDRSRWAAHDAVALIEGGARVPELLVDQGTADEFLTEQLRPELLADACRVADIPCTLRMQPCYDHSYGFVSTFLADHVNWHADRLAR